MGLVTALKAGASAAMKMPLMSASIAGGLASEVAPPIARAAMGTPLQDQIKMEVNSQREMALAQAKNQRLLRQMAINTSRLASIDPHLYNEVLAGRRLPKGAVMFGGKPREDLMEALAMKMSTGEFKNPDVPENPLDGMI